GSHQTQCAQYDRASESWAAFAHETPTAQCRGGPQQELRQEGDRRCDSRTMRYGNPHGALSFSELQGLSLRASDSVPSVRPSRPVRPATNSSWEAISECSPKSKNAEGSSPTGGIVTDPVALMAASGMNLARLRLWVDPYTAAGEAYGGGTNDLVATIAMARRAKAHGMRILLDIHLSDWWADPGTQTKPKAWRSLSYADLVDTVHDYTEDVIGQMRSAEVLPDMVQMGNETTADILWDDGKVGPGNQDLTQLAELLQSGIDGVRGALGPGDGVEIILHLDHGGDNALYRWWFDGIVAENVDFDV